MPSFNKVVIMGNLCRAPELRYTPSGTAVADLRLAVNRTYVVQGDKREDTTFVTVVAWGKQAEACGEYLDKGACVLVDGRLQSRDWEGKDGTKRTTTEVVAETIKFVHTKRSNGVPAAVGAPSGFPDDAAGGDDDVPF